MAKRVRLTGAERRQIILDAAAELFAAKGFHETSVNEIAEGSGVSKIVLYDHFASKEDLFIELTRNARDGLIARGKETMQAGGPIEERLRLAFDAFFAYAHEQPDRARLLFLVPRGEPSVRNLVTSIQEEGTRGLVDILAAESGLLKGEPDREERLILIMEFLKVGLHGLVEWWLNHPHILREQLVATAMDVAWNGLSSHYRN
jgi:AcrR family transcriptional regulator